MTVLATALASQRVMYSQGAAPITKTTAYTAPAYSANVTSTPTPSPTAIIKEIVIANYFSSPVTLRIWVGGVIFLYDITIAANDTKILNQLNTMIAAGGIIEIQAGTASALAVTISGIEVQ